MKEKTKISEQALLGMRRGAALALAEHKRKGIPIAVMKDGKVVRIPPEDIVVPEVE